MFSGQKKTPKSQKPDNVPLYFHRIHTETEIDYNALWTQNYRQLTIIDIGYENLCRRISRRHIFPKKIELRVADKTDVRIETDEEDYRVLFQDIKTWLELHREEYFASHVLIIEWQLPQNYKAVRISTFILSYLMLLLEDAPLKPLLCEMRSGFKDNYYPVLKPLNQNARKAKGVEVAEEHCHLSGDMESLEIMLGSTSKKKKKKQDDVADTILMEESFCLFAEENGWSFPNYRTTRTITLTRKEPDRKVRIVKREVL
jgi:hypothetical protein